MHKTRAQRREEALARQGAWAKLSIAQRLAKLRNRGAANCREYARLFSVVNYDR